MSENPYQPPKPDREFLKSILEKGNSRSTKVAIGGGISLAVSLAVAVISAITTPRELGKFNAVQDSALILTVVSMAVAVGGVIYKGNIENKLAALDQESGVSR